MITPSVKGSDLKRDDFYLEQFHFHWSYNDYHGSEYFIGSRRFPLEAHFVHKSKSSGQIAVLAFLFEVI